MYETKRKLELDDLLLQIRTIVMKAIDDKTHEQLKPIELVAMAVEKYALDEFKKGFVKFNPEQHKMDNNVIPFKR